MTDLRSAPARLVDLPAWVPDAAHHYLAHTELGVPIRALARRAGCHASTVLRQVRKFENLRDDPLVDAGLRRLGARHYQRHASDPGKDTHRMSVHPRPLSAAAEDSAAKLRRDAPRILRRLCEKGAVLAIAKDMDKAVVVRDAADGGNARTAAVDADVVEAMALKDWIKCRAGGRVSRYTVTAAGRAALTRMMAERENTAGQAFAEQHRAWGEREIAAPGRTATRKHRYNMAESPLTALSRRRDKTGEPFLSEELVAAGERLREDFELAQMGPRVAQNWERFMTGGTRGGFAPDSGVGEGPSGARRRVGAALEALGPGLGDVALRCCCYLEGLESAEKRMGWSARSGKIVLRIALQRLRLHYDSPGGASPLIG